MRRRKFNPFKFLGFFVSWTIFVWLCASFITLSIWPSEWPTGGRFFATAVWIVAGLAIGDEVVMERDEDA